MKDIKSTLDWYSANRTIYKNLCEKIEFILNEIFKIQKINIHSISSRAKDLTSFEGKIRNPKYNDPANQITDLAGIRVVCYVESDLKKICEIIENNFKIDLENSSDKSDLLGDDKVGYRSIHYIFELEENRLLLPEYHQFSNLKFEIQIRTILQHAWAEIEHDRSYKFSGKLPQEISRRFRLLSGNLELIDKEFDNIALAIDKISEEVIKGTESGNLDFEINSTTLENYLSTKFKNSIESGIMNKDFGTNDSGKNEILEELQNFGLETINDLDEIIPDDFESNIKEVGFFTNFLGVLRTLMIIDNSRVFFEHCFNYRWTIDELYSEEKLLNKYGVRVDELLRKYS